MKKIGEIVQMIKVGICDDEKIVLELLKSLVEQCLKELGEDSTILTFDSGEKLLEEAKGLDILFLDIEMPGMDGIETGKRIPRQNPDCKIIMATSRQERFKEAFKINAFRFVTKPFQKEEIKEALKDVFQTRVGMEKIEVYRERVPYTFFQKDILYVATVDSSVEFVLRECVFRKETSLKELETILDDRIFYRVNKQCIVNMQHIDTYKNGVIRIGEAEIRVSIRKKKEFEKAYIMFDVSYR